MGNRWRLHPEPGGKLYAKGPHWSVCNDDDCPHEHVWWEPFRPIETQEIDLSHLAPTAWAKS